MKLKDIYADSRPVFSFEFFPPKTEKGEAALLEEVENLKRLAPSFFSLTYGAGGGTREKTVSLGGRIRQLSGIETVCHITCVGQSRDAVREVLREIKALGMENVMALRGDPPAGQAEWQPHPDGFLHASELVAEARRLGDFSVAVAGFPEMHPESTNRQMDLHFLKQKIAMGADVVVTQLFFDNEDFYSFDRDLKSIGVTVPIVPGILPILSAAQVRRMSALCKARIPPKLDAMLSEVDGDDEAARQLGIEYAARQIAGLIAHGAPGVHIYCLNRSYSAEVIFRKLRLAEEHRPLI